MRDGVELSADIWLPKVKNKYPAILIRTPYVKARGRQLGFVKKLVSNGYVVVLQDVRGRGDSDGIFLTGDEGEDGFDSIAWIATQPWSNGDICTMGGSYLAAVQWAAARNKPPHLRCMASVSTAGMHGLMYVGGAVSSFMLQWLNMTSGRMDQRAIAATLDWNNILQHRPLSSLDLYMGRSIPSYQKFLTIKDPDFDFVSKSRLNKDDFQTIQLPVLHVTGWFDIALVNSVETWTDMSEYSPARNKQFLMIGPWDHWQSIMGSTGQLGEMNFKSDSIVDMSDLHVKFFDSILKEKSSAINFPRARIYVTGSNQWIDLDTYPPKQNRLRRLYLHSEGNANTNNGNGSLNFEQPDIEPADKYTYDPKNPVPASMGKPVPAGDQHLIEQRKDVLVYTTSVINEPIDVIGTVTMELYAKSDARDTDFVVNLVDVYPDGKAIRLGPLNTGIIRARYRNGFGKAQLLIPGKIEQYKILLHDIGHTFQSGHKIRLEVSSSAYPQILPNQNTGNSVETDVEWKVAQQTIYHTKEFPSALVLPVFSNTNDKVGNNSE